MLDARYRMPYLLHIRVPLDRSAIYRNLVTPKTNLPEKHDQQE